MMFGTPAVVLFLAVFDRAAAYSWPSPQYDALERFIYEGSRIDNDGLFHLLQDCGPRIFFPSDIDSKPTTIAAEWLRVAYHDMATHNITDQSGGLDGSIHFEFDRAENVGDGIKNTLSEYSLFPNKHVSKADVIAFGGALAVADCGGPLIPLRGGRIDATQAGPMGVPEPQQDIETHIEKFRLQGFNSTEMIELVACGHTIGGVESTDFPQIVSPPLPAGSENISDSFDTTTRFDTAVVTEYLDNTTLNPLVVGANITTRSDLRIFNSDGNVTMRALANAAVFKERCSILLERMLNTVPAGVQLTEPIEVLTEKTYEASLYFLEGKLTFLTTFRRARPVSDSDIDLSAMSLHWCDRYGDNANCKLGTSNKAKGAHNSSLNQKTRQSPMMKGLGLKFHYASFQVEIDAARSVSYFWFEISNTDGSTTVYDQNGDKYPLVQDSIMIPTQMNELIGGVILGNGSTLQTRSIMAAVRTELSPSRVYARVLDVTHTDKPANGPIDFLTDLTRNTSVPSVPGYDVYTGEFNTIGGGFTLDFMVDVDGKTSMLDFILSASVETGSHLDVPLGKVEKAPYSGKTLSLIDKLPSSSSSLNVPGLIYTLFSFLIFVAFI